MKRTLIISAVFIGASVGAFAQTAASTVARDVKQDQRIESGLKDGSLSTQEAAKLQRDEAKVDHLQAKELKDGKITPAEQARLKAAQDKTSQDIYAAKHNDVKGNPQSASSKRMQADVQRNVEQQKRVEGGIQNGSLTNHEVAKLERGQARVDRTEAAAGRDGHVSALEQKRVQRKENRQSKKIFQQKHDAQERKG